MAEQCSYVERQPGVVTSGLRCTLPTGHVEDHRPQSERVAAKSQVDVVVVPDTRRVIRYKRDQVGNDLTAVLRWCDTHSSALWQFDDESYQCEHDLITRVLTDDHDIIDGPWEVQG